ncbi:MAG TPA: hypothetical protein VM051_00175 [Usitatibacter sp.]|nr:hypothetical protein [Usitatibacter sp.]
MRRKTAASVLNPVFAWQMLGMRMVETMVHSSHVISHRTQRQNNAAQLFEMGAEKVQAALESSHALSRHWMKLSGRDPLAVWTAMPVMLASGFAPFARRAKRNARLIRTLR